MAYVSDFTFNGLSRIGNDVCSQDINSIENSQACSYTLQNYFAQDCSMKNAKALGEVLKEGGIDLLTGGTDCHMLLLDLRSIGISGKDAADVLEQANMTCNKNGIPKDPQPPTITSGIRVGTPAATTRGFKEEEFKEVGRMMLSILKAAAQGNAQSEIATAKAQAIQLCKRFPIYE